jgi:hypothetical protein
MPVKSVTVADPPRINIASDQHDKGADDDMDLLLTMTFVARPKNMKTRWATVPHRALMISRKLDYKLLSATVGEQTYV